MEKVKVKITAIVHTTVELKEGETIEDLKKRYVDIYLHGPKPDGHLDKEDLGADDWDIEIVD